ncbi:uncharacterized protein MYCFIDRAFT_204508 [Pseudocercospora fijiensis CIRAD86]|uniref:Uncharacterized protein n=1 Tax=Pseudocercospora fijiensis (strain CIRAD86) TaxID=383855 RepID=M2YR97_PSEFD|nr:uncharacterized protein MYCFIDRAFT_204508 [Pseudocercospora fijiensis CIRAD86]EME80225.1 hypothetical protein MYCFIDRAFT_204508 [Pseudocercospora fijiensis CIRAD86]
MLLSAIAGTIFVSFTSADYTQFYFNSSNGCDGLAFGCEAPFSMCAYDSVKDKYYCCSGEYYNACRAFSTSCTDSASTQTCGDGSWCCLSETSGERCTSRSGQINVCVATQDNLIADVSQLLMNETYSSLTAANPSATTYSVDVTSLVALATSSSSSSIATTSTASVSSTSSTASPVSAAAAPRGTPIATGAIAGGVVGGVAGLAIIGGAIWFFLRRSKKAKSKSKNQDLSSPTAAEKRDQFPGSGGFQSPAPQYEVAEMEGTREVGEMAGSRAGERKFLMRGEVSEMPGGRDEVRELPG